MHWQPDALRHAVAFERAAVTQFTFVTVFMPACFSYYAMAVLVQLPQARLYKMALLPIVFWMTLRANMSLDFSQDDPGRAYVNHGLALGMFTIAMRSAAWAFAEQPYTRLPFRKSGNGTANGHDGRPPTEHGTTLSSALWNAWDLTANFRGIGWTGPPKNYIPTPYFRVESRLTFTLLSFCRLILLVFVFDALCGYIRSFGPDTFGTPKGGTVFDPALPPSKRYTKSLTVSLLSGFTAYFIIDATYQLHAVLYTMLFQQYPSQWPPLFDAPWLSTSLTSFWGWKWHQLFRESFVMVGSNPMGRYFGRTGVIMGAFLVSGVMHDVGLRGMARGGDTLLVAGFFLMQGVGVLMERKWKRATGTRVGGIVGWLWTFSWATFWGQMVVDAWARRGLLGSEFFPEAYRPSRLFLNWISGI